MSSAALFTPSLSIYVSVHKLNKVIVVYNLSMIQTYHAVDVVLKFDNQLSFAKPNNS